MTPYTYAELYLNADRRDHERSGHRWILDAGKLRAAMDRGERFAKHAPHHEATAEENWTGSPAPEAPDDWWIDDETGEYIDVATGQRLGRADALAVIHGEG